MLDYVGVNTTFGVKLGVGSVKTFFFFGLHLKLGENWTSVDVKV